MFKGFLSWELKLYPSSFLHKKYPNKLYHKKLLHTFRLLLTFHSLFLLQLIQFKSHNLFIISFNLFWVRFRHMKLKVSPYSTLPALTSCSATPPSHTYPAPKRTLNFVDIFQFAATWKFFQREAQNKKKEKEKCGKLAKGKAGKRKSRGNFA